MVHALSFQTPACRLLKYRVLPNKRARRAGRKRTPNLAGVQWNWQGGLLSTPTLSAENFLHIGSVVFEIWQVKVKSQGACLFRQAHLFGEIRYALNSRGIPRDISTTNGDRTLLFINVLRKFFPVVWQLKREWSSLSEKCKPVPLSDMWYQVSQYISPQKMFR